MNLAKVSITKFWANISCLILILFSLLQSGQAVASSYVVKVAPGYEGYSVPMLNKALRGTYGAGLQVQRKLGVPGYFIVQMDSSSRASSFALSRLNAAPELLHMDRNDIVGTSEDSVVFNDAALSSQTPYLGSSSFAGHGFLDALAASAGSSEVRIAVIDTGIGYPQDLAGRIDRGIDLVSEQAFSNDGDGRDNDATDSGSHCNGSNSSWHGLRVASVIASTGNNGYALVGAAPNSRIVPIRALGACGGLDSDVADAIVWAAGGTVYAADGQTPMKKISPVNIINLSVGRATTCSALYQDAVDYAIKRGVFVVASAGNNAASVPNAPANCVGVIAVSSVGADGFKLRNSSGAGTTGVSAIGEAIFTITDTGAKQPVNTYRILRSAGTSFSAALVSSAIHHLISASPQSGYEEIRSALLSSVKPYPDSAEVQSCHLDMNARCACTKKTCGLGILDLNEAIKKLDAPIKVHPGLSLNVEPGETVSLDAARSSSTFGPIQSWSWSQVEGVTVEPSVRSGSVFEFLPSVSGLYRFNLTVTDATGRFSTSTMDVFASPGGTSVPLGAPLKMVDYNQIPHSLDTQLFVSEANEAMAPIADSGATPSPSQSSSGGGGGGGGVGVHALLLLFSMLLIARSRRHQTLIQ